MALDKKRNPNLLDMELMELWGVGYELPLVDQCTVDIRENDKGYRVYGMTGDASFIEIAGGQLTMNTLYDDDMQVLSDLLTDQDPERDDTLLGYYPQDSIYTHIVRMLKDKDERGYVRAELWPYWHTSLKPLTGTPGSYGEINQAGQTDIPIAIKTKQNTKNRCAILTDVVPLASALTYGQDTGMSGLFNFYRPEQVPVGMKGYQNTGKFALLLEIQRRNSSTNTMDDPETEARMLRVTQEMVQVVDTDPLTPPTITVAKATGTSALKAGKYWYKVTVEDNGGESQSPAAVSASADNVAGDINTLTIPRVAGATRYNLYRAKVAAGGAAPTDISAYGFLTSLPQPVSGNPPFADDGSLRQDMSNVSPGSSAATDNSTGRGLGRVFVTDADISDAGWSLSDAGVHYFAFVHYILLYKLTGDDVMLVGDGLKGYGRWQTPDLTGITWS